MENDHAYILSTQYNISMSIDIKTLPSRLGVMRQAIMVVGVDEAHQVEFHILVILMTKLVLQQRAKTRIKSERHHCFLNRVA